MKMSKYQEEARKTAFYPQEYNIVYPALGLAGEAGEVAEKVKKMIRDGTFIKEDIAKEISDCLWYIANLAHDIGYNLDVIAEINLEKLRSRAKRGVLSGEGDNR